VKLRGKRCPPKSSKLNAMSHARPAAPVLDEEWLLRDPHFTPVPIAPAAVSAHVVPSDSEERLVRDACGCQSPPLDPQDVTNWAAFLPTVRVGGALPVTFRSDGDHVVVEVIVPYVAPEPQPPADPNKIPIAIAEGFPVPLTMRYKLPAYSPVNASHFIRHLVREIYHHEIDEQLRVNGTRPFAPEH